jgi:hypothetical protein
VKNIYIEARQIFEYYCAKHGVILFVPEQLLFVIPSRYNMVIPSVNKQSCTSWHISLLAVE